MSEYIASKNSILRRSPQLGSYDKLLIHALIDAAHYCHMSAQVQGRPYIQATVHWREGERIYVHGAQKNKMIHALAQGAEAAVAFTHFDGYVLTRSAFAHSVSYRSVTQFSKARVIEDLQEKNKPLALLIESTSSGRWTSVRQPTKKELKMTGILEFSIAEISAKMLMQGQQVLPEFPASEYEIDEDKHFDPWTGIYPYRLVKEEPLSSSQVKAIHESEVQRARKE